MLIIKSCVTAVQINIIRTEYSAAEWWPIHTMIDYQVHHNLVVSSRHLAIWNSNIATVLIRHRNHSLMEILKSSDSYDLFY